MPKELDTRHNLCYRDLDFAIGVVDIEYDENDNFYLTVMSKYGGARINVKFDAQFSRAEISTKNIAAEFKVIP